MTGSFKKRGAGWQLSIYLGTENGKQKYYRKQFVGSLRAAQSEMTRLLSMLQKGEPIQPEKCTLSAYITRWLDAIRANIAPKTHERYVELLRLYVEPELGKVPLGRLNSLQIQTLEAELSRTGSRRYPGRGLSLRTVLHVHRVLKTALNRAVDWGILSRNPVTAVAAPKPERKETTFLSPEELIRLFDGLAGTRLYLPTVLASSLGTRRGETLALRWQDVNWDQRTVAIRQSVEETNSGVRFKPVKTKRSRRPVPFDSLELEALREARLQQARNRQLFGSDYIESGLVCTLEDGSPWRPDDFTSEFVRAARRLGFVRLRFHDLRHTHASVQLIGGTHPKVVSERLGHSNIAITMDLYSHVMPTLQQEAAGRFNQLLADARKKQKKSAGVVEIAKAAGE